MVYLLVFVGITFLAWFEIFVKISRKIKYSFITLTSLVFLILSTIRWERGTDWIPYYDYFMSDSMINYLNWEIGYIFLNKFSKFFFGNNYTVLIFICSVMIFFFQKNAVKNFSHDNRKLDKKNDFHYVYSMIIFLGLWSVYLGHIFFVRNTIAFVILFYSIKFIKSKNFYKFLTLFALAVLFHRSSVVFIFAYFIYHMKITKIRFAFFLVISFFILKYFDIILLKTAESLGTSFFTRATIYLQMKSGKTPWYSLVNTILLQIVFTYMYIKKYNKNQQYSGLFKLYSFGFLLYLGAYAWATVFYRIAIPFIIVQVVLIPYVFGLFRTNSTKMLVFIFVVVYYGLRLYSALLNYWPLFIPFKTIFCKECEVILY